MVTVHNVIEISTVISLAGFLLSGVALFFSQLRPPKLASVIGPSIKMYYPPDGGFGLYIPVTFLNRSPRTGTVLRCGITLYRKSVPEERFFMEWRFFSRLEKEVSFVLEEPAHALAVPGSSSTTKILWLTWRAHSKPELRIAEGEYGLIFHYWTANIGKPHHDFHVFVINEAVRFELDNYRVARSSSIVDVTLDRAIAGNKLLTSDESKNLLGA